MRRPWSYTKPSGKGRPDADKDARGDAHDAREEADDDTHDDAREKADDDTHDDAREEADDDTHDDAHDDAHEEMRNSHGHNDR